MADCNRYRQYEVQELGFGYFGLRDFTKRTTWGLCSVHCCGRTLAEVGLSALIEVESKLRNPEHTCYNNNNYTQKKKNSVSERS